jgi:RNA polymerase sigma-70 factor (ECF subfamily)
MLQAVLGLDAARIAGAFLASPAAMAQRLVRAKARLREGGLRFEIPGREAMPARLQAVLEAIYAAYGSGWEDIAGADPRRRGLAEEALFLARLLAALLPAEPEALGLAALLCHCEARRTARRGPGGGFIPLAEQDVAQWDRALQAEAETTLTNAFAQHRPGRYQLEAAIQSAHAARAVLGSTPWAGVLALYGALVRLAPTTGALVGQAAAAAEAEGAEAGLALLDALPAAPFNAYQPYHALRAHLLARLGQDASASYRRAIGLAEDPAVRDFLAARMG